MLNAYAARSTWRCGTASSRCCVTLAAIVATRLALSPSIAEGLLPARGHRPASRSRPRRRRTSPSTRMVATAAAGRGHHPRAIPAVDVVNSTVGTVGFGARRRATPARMFVDLKPLANATPRRCHVIQRLRGKLRDHAGRQRLHDADPEHHRRRPLVAAASTSTRCRRASLDELDDGRRR